MFRTAIKGVFLLTTLASTRMPAQQMYPELHQEGRAKWEDIVVPKTYVFDNADSVPENAELLPETEVEGYFQHLRWKRGVQLFEYYRTMARELLASLDDKTSWVHPENIGYFIEKIDSEAKAFELVMSFHIGVLLTGEADIKSLMEACRDSKVAQVAEGMPEAIEPICRFDPKLDAYRVSFCMYQHRNVFEAKYVVTPDGFMGSSLQNYVVGPERVSGWDITPSDEYEQYRKTSEAFTQAIAEPLEKIAVGVMTNSELEKKGLGKARENALSWLSSWGDISEHAAAMRDFVDTKGDMIDPLIKKRAILKLKSVGAGIGEEGSGALSVRAGPKPAGKEPNVGAQIKESVLPPEEPRSEQGLWGVWSIGGVLLGAVVGVAFIGILILVKIRAR